MLKTEIVKNIVLTSCMVTLGLSTIIVGSKIETLQESSARQSVISSINLTSSASIQNKKKKATTSSARVQSRPTSSNSISVPLVSSPSSTIKPVSVTAAPSVVVAPVPMVAKLSVSDMNHKNAAYGNTSNAGGNNSLSSSTRMLATVSGNTSSHSVTISEPFSDSRPSSTVHTRVNPGGPGVDPDVPEETPLGDGIGFLLCCILSYTTYLYVRKQRITK